MQVGANDMKTLGSLKITTSKGSVPNSYQTKLCQSIVRPIQNAGYQHLLNCNRVAVKDESHRELARHHFLIENVGKDMSIEQMFEQMCYNDFSEKETQIGKIDGSIEQISKTNKNFLEILDARTRKNGNHCEVPLPFKQKIIKTPNNRSQALERMQHLKREG